jgi:hypothetical protein
MTIIEIASLSNGAHRNQTILGVLSKIPEGWAVVPDEMELPKFPFGEVKTKKTNGIMTVTKWIPGTLPEPEPTPETEPEASGELATKADVQAVWDSMAAAYNEGVNEA